MRRYTAAQARQRLSELLDAAESGQDVVIERRGVRFTVKLTSTGRRRNAPSHVAYLDPIVEDGEWTWEWGPEGLDPAPRAQGNDEGRSATQPPRDDTALGRRGTRG